MIMNGIVLSINQTLESKEETPDYSFFWEAIDKTVSQSHYQLQLTFSLDLSQEIITGNYTFDIDHQFHKQKIAATVNKEGTISWNATIDEYDNKYYYEDSTQGITVPEMANVEYFFELMKEAKEITANSFVISKETLEKRLNATSMPFMSGVKENENLIVDHDVTYYYEMSNQMFTQMESTFSINNGKLISANYQIKSLPDSMTEDVK